MKYYLYTFTDSTTSTNLLYMFDGFRLYYRDWDGGYDWYESNYCKVDSILKEMQEGETFTEIDECEAQKYLLLGELS